MKRIVLAAILGGLVVFIVSAICHMATPLGTAGMMIMPNEDPVIDNLRANLTESKVYFFPGMSMQAKPSEAEQKAWEEKVRRGPSGLIIYTAGGTEPAFPKQLAIEFLTVVLSCFVAAWVLSRVVGSYASRVIIVTLFALFAFLSISASHWNWYAYPSAFILAEAAGEIISYLLAGLVIAKIVPPPVSAA
jgi:hypothetical protein